MQMKSALCALIGGDVEEEVGSYLFNHLDQIESNPRELTAYLFELENRGIEIPQRMIDEVTMDAVCNVGNKIVDHYYVGGEYVRDQKL